MLVVYHEIYNTYIESFIMCSFQLDENSFFIIILLVLFCLNVYKLAGVVLLAKLVNMV